VLRSTFVRFVFVGFANTAIAVAIIFTAKLLLGVGDVTANAAGYAVGLVASFVLNKRWTFGFQGDRLASMLRFLMVFAIAYAANLATVMSCIKFLHLDSFWSQALGIPPYTLLFYAGSRWYAFPAARSCGNRSAQPCPPT
jgi:putative flippase GtrA